jgi:hypothetical protein
MKRIVTLAPPHRAKWNFEQTNVPEKDLPSECVHGSALHSKRRVIQGENHDDESRKPKGGH